LLISRDYQEVGAVIFQHNISIIPAVTRQKSLSTRAYGF